MLRLTATALALLTFIGCGRTLTASDWKPLFNGKDLSGWEPVGDPSVWQVKDGAIHCTGKGHGWLSTKDEYANFELQLEYKLPEGGNSGVFLRSPRTGDASHTGMEIQVLDDDAPHHKNILPYQHSGSLYGIQPANPRLGGNPGHWQRYHIICDGRRVKVIQNGTTIVDVDLDKKKGIASEFVGYKRPQGYIGLQDHASEVDFRNIRIRQLP